MTVELEEWEPNFVEGKHFSMLVFASRASGKSYLIKYLLKYKLRDKYDEFVVFTQSMDEMEEYTSVLKSGRFYNEYKHEIIDEIRRSNKILIDQKRQPKNTLVVFDDMISNKQKYDDSLLQLFANGRHDGISIIFSSQSHTYASSTWRNNASILISLKQNSRQSRDAVKKNILYGSVEVPEEKNESQYYESIMREYMGIPGDALVIDFRDKGFDNLYWFRAPDMLVSSSSSSDEEYELDLSSAEEIEEKEEEKEEEASSYCTIM